MKTFRDYINENSFEDVWTAIVEIFEEPEDIKPVYAEYYEKLRKLPFNPQKGEIRFEDLRYICFIMPHSQPLGMNDAPERLIDKAVFIDEEDLEGVKANQITAILVYWASFNGFITSKEHDDDLHEYLKIITEDGSGRRLREYLNRKDPYSEIKRASLVKKGSLFWKHRTDRIGKGNWRDILWVLKAAIEFNIGFMRGYADHAGREHDADRMQLCCNLIDIATKNIYPDAREKKALRILFGILEKEIYHWDD